MTSIVQGGFGSVFKIKVTSTLTAVTHATDIKWPEFEKMLVDVTAHDSPGGMAEWIATGKRKMNSFEVTLAWSKDDATHAAILAAYNADPAVAMSVQDPDGDEVISFNGHVQKLGRVTEQDGYMQMKVTIQPTGLGTTGS